MIQYTSGKTPLIKISEFCDKFDLPNLLIKDESKNPFGTWKDRRSQAILKKAQANMVDKLCLITSGNAGFSLAKFAQGSKLKINLIVHYGLSHKIKESLEKVCHQLIPLDLSKKILSPAEVVSLVRQNSSELVWDVSNGFHEAYETIIEELDGNYPDYIVCPVGSGEGFYGLWSGLQKVKAKTRVVGVGVGANPSFADKLHASWSPYNKKIESSLNSEHVKIILTEEEVKTAFLYSKKYVNFEPSSSVVIGALTKIKFKKTDTIIMINSGKGLF